MIFSLFTLSRQPNEATQRGNPTRQPINPTIKPNYTPLLNLIIPTDIKDITPPYKWKLPHRHKRYYPTE